jgi:hypothetical protein
MAAPSGQALGEFIQKLEDNKDEWSNKYNILAAMMLNGTEVRCETNLRCCGKGKVLTLEAEKSTKNKWHFANAYLGATRNGNHSQERLVRLQAVTTVWFSSMIIPNFFFQLLPNWKGISGTKEGKTNVVAMMKGVWNGVLKNDELAWDSYEDYRRFFAYNEWVFMLIANIGLSLEEHKPKKCSKAARRNKVGSSSQIDNLEDTLARLEAVAKQNQEVLMAKPRSLAQSL